MERTSVKLNLDSKKKLQGKKYISPTEKLTKDYRFKYLYDYNFQQFLMSLFL